MPVPSGLLLGRGVSLPPFRETGLERISSVGAYDEPRRKGVPRILNLGVPNLYDGIGISRNGTPEGDSSADLGRVAVPGLSMMTLKAPISECCMAPCWSSRVENERP